MPAPKKSRPSREFTTRAAYPGKKAAGQHKARWFRLLDRLRRLEGEPQSTRAFLLALLEGVRKRPHLKHVFLGFGGVKGGEKDQEGRTIKAGGGVSAAAQVRAQRAAQTPPPAPGAAELSGMSRSSMIRGRRRLAALGDVDIERGRGRGKANSYALAGEFEPVPAPAPMEPEDPALLEQRARGREQLRAAVEGLREPRPRGP